MARLALGGKTTPANLCQLCSYSSVELCRIQGLVHGGKHFTGKLQLWLDSYFPQARTFCVALATLVLAGEAQTDLELTVILLPQPLGFQAWVKMPASQTDFCAFLLKK